MAVHNPKFLPGWIKFSALVTVNLFVYTGNMYASGLATAFSELEAYFQLSNPQFNGLIVWSVLSMGLANLVWMPTALCFGKRSVVFFSMAVFLGGTIWSAVATSYNSLLASRVVASFGYGSIESLGPSILADLFFERSYSSAMASYAFSLSAGSQFGPMIAGYLVQARGWRWHFILCIIIIAFNLVMTIFLLPETLYETEHVEGLTAFDIDKSTQAEKIEDIHIEDGGNTTSEQQQEPICWKTYLRGLVTVTVSDEARKSGVLRHWLYLFWLPLPLLLVPSVLLASVSYGVVLGGIVAISALSPTLFSPPPYNFTSVDLGLFSLSTFIGVIIAWPLAGPATDQLSRWMRKRNGDIHKPEHRLPALILPFLISPTGLAVFGYTVSLQRQYVQPAVGAAMTASALTLVPSVMLAYVIDAHPWVSGEALVLINASKNVVAFGLAKDANTWMASSGVAKMFYELAACEWGVLLLAIPLYFSGEWVRRKCLNWMQ